MGIASAARRLVDWFIHPEQSIRVVNCAASVEQAGDRLAQQAKQLKKALKDSGRHRRDMLGLALDDLRGRSPALKKSKSKSVPTEIPPPPKFTPAAATVEPPAAKPTKPRRKRRG